MRRSVFHTRNVRNPRRVPVAMRELENAALRGKFADSFDDRVSEALVEYDDEREVMDIVVRAMTRTVN